MTHHLTEVEKKIRRKIAKGSKQGRYGVGRRRSRARPGRKSSIKCKNCGNTIGKFHNHDLCDKCVTKVEKKMNIPGMSAKK